jgi:hypothetical protein
MSLEASARGSILYGPPKPRTSTTSDFRQEPGAGKPHAGICAGAGGNSRPYRDIHIGPEPCGGTREGIGEASAGDRAGQPLSRGAPGDRQEIDGASPLR